MPLAYEVCERERRDKGDGAGIYNCDRTVGGTGSIDMVWYCLGQVLGVRGPWRRRLVRRASDSRDIPFAYNDPERIWVIMTQDRTRSLPEEVCQEGVGLGCSVGSG